MGRIALLLAGTVAGTWFATIDHAAADTGCGVETPSPRVAFANERASVPPSAPSRPDCMHVTGSPVTSRFVSLGVGKSVVLDFDADIKDVFVSDPKLVMVTVKTKRQAYL